LVVGHKKLWSYLASKCVSSLNSNINKSFWVFEVVFACNIAAFKLITISFVLAISLLR
jgi:hypothetical protein